jgi:hypothetical protein
MAGDEEEVFTTCFVELVTSIAKQVKRLSVAYSQIIGKELIFRNRKKNLYKGNIEVIE